MVNGDLLALPFADASFDVLFSTATFHWVLDPAALHRSVARVLAPGGRLHAQCGGAGNVQRLYDRAGALMREPRFAPHFTGWSDPWIFLAPEQAARHLRAAGLEPTRVDLEATPTPFASRADFRIFVERVVIAAWLARLPDDRTRDTFLDALCEAAAADDPPYVLDYVRLNLEAVRKA